MYQALYRKYRPKKFSEVVGQEIVVRTLSNALIKNRTSHAYMFSGPRGTGKTTFAKIFAKNINCLTPVNGEACGQCDNCLHINDSSPVDIIEIDAASNNGVDEIREIRNKVNIVPAYLKYKVYIIDEVHMLTIGAFNALLKTLEEPPSHVIFILATTDPQKVPNTIVSRCQLFAFERLSIIDLTKKMREISVLENIVIDDECLETIAVYSDGGMRDALGLFDKLISYSNDKITIEDVRKISGLISFEKIREFNQYLLAGDIKKIVEFINNLNNNGIDIINFVNEIIKELSNQMIEKIKENKTSTSNVYKLIMNLNDILNLMRISANPIIIFETSLLKYLLENDKIISREIIIEENVNQSEEKFDLQEDLQKEKTILVEEEKQTDTVETKLIETEEKEQTFANNFEEIYQIRINNTFAKASKKQLLTLKKQWNKLNDYTLDRTLGSAVCLLVDGVLRAASEENVILSFKYDSLVERGKAMQDRIEKALNDIFEIKLNVVLITDENWENQRLKFIENKNNNIEYHYIEEPEFKKAITQEKTIQSKKVSEIANEAISIFGDNIVEIK